MAFSCYFNIINPEVAIYQKKIFDLFETPINQEFGIFREHGEYMDNIIKNVDSDVYIFFDIDAIPLKKNIFEYIVDKIKDGNSFIGIEQGILFGDMNTYAGPACMGISKIVYEKLKRPTFCTIPEKNCDTAGGLTYAAKENDVDVKYFKITNPGDKQWECKDIVYGHGTIYDNCIYHQFESHSEKYGEEFINYCKQILNEN